MSDTQQAQRLHATEIGCRVIRAIPRPSGKRLGKSHVMHNRDPKTGRECWVHFTRHCFDGGGFTVWYWALEQVE